MSKLNDRNLAWAQVEAIADFRRLSPRYVYNVAVGNKPWRSAHPMLVHQLYDAGWKAIEGRGRVRLWLNVQAAKAQRQANELLTT